jgi:hypothetical protein
MASYAPLQHPRIVPRLSCPPILPNPSTRLHTPSKSIAPAHASGTTHALPPLHPLTEWVADPPSRALGTSGRAPSPPSTS